MNAHEQEIQGLRKGPSAGFTLVEVMVVIAIISILAAIGIPKLTNYLDRATANEADQQFGRILADLESFFDKHQSDAATKVTNLNTYNCLAPPDGAGGVAPCTKGTDFMGDITSLELRGNAKFNYYAAALATDTDGDGTNDSFDVCITAIYRDDTTRTILFSSNATNEPTWENHVSLRDFFDGTTGHNAAGNCTGGAPLDNVASAVQACGADCI